MSLYYSWRTITGPDIDTNLELPVQLEQLPAGSLRQHPLSHVFTDRSPCEASSRLSPVEMLASSQAYYPFELMREITHQVCPSRVDYATHALAPSSIPPEHRVPRRPTRPCGHVEADARALHLLSTVTGALLSSDVGASLSAAQQC